MSLVKGIDILPGDHVDFLIPLTVQFIQGRELFGLSGVKSEKYLSRMSIALVPASCRATPEGRSKDEIIEEHPHIQQQVPGPEIAFSQFTHGAVEDNALPAEANREYGHGPAPVIEQQAQHRDRVVEELGDEIKAEQEFVLGFVILGRGVVPCFSGGASPTRWSWGWSG